MRKILAIILTIIFAATPCYGQLVNGGGGGGTGTGMAEDGSVAWTGAPVPSSAGGVTIGTTSAEWGHIYLHDGKGVYFQADQSVSIIPSAGVLTFTAAGEGMSLTASANLWTISSATDAVFTIDKQLSFTANPRIYDGSHYLTFDADGLTGDATIVFGANTNNLKIDNGTAGLDIAASAALNIDTSLQTTTGAIVLTGQAGGSSVTLPATGTLLASDGDGSSLTGLQLDQFVTQTAWRIFYSNADGDIVELALGTDGYLLKAKGASAAPEWSNTFSAQIDDSAAQFKSATASKGTLKFDQTGITDAKVVTVKYTATDNVTHNPTLTATGYNFGAINVLSTGNISGKVPMITKSDNYTLGTDDAQEAYGYMVWMSGDAKILTLPAVAAGMSVCVYSTDALTKVVDPNGSDGIRMGAARDTDGHKITSPGAIGDFVCLVADSADGWTVLGKSGTWVAE